MKKYMSLIVLALIFSLSMGIQAQSLLVEHELGEVIIPKDPKKVVVFDYGVLDALDYLEVDVVGLPGSNLPPFLTKYESKEYVDVGTLFEPNFEQIYALNPDLIIISGRQADAYDELSKLGPTLYVSIDADDYWGSVQENLRLLGQIFSKKSQVEEVIEQFAVDLKRLNTKTQASNIETLILMVNDGALSVYGPQSRFGFIHQAAGFAAADRYIEGTTHGQNVSFEYLIKTDPDVIFVVDRAAIAGGSLSAQQTLNNPLVKMTKAYANDGIIYLNSHAWYVVSGGITSTRMMIEDLLQVF